MSVTHVYLFFHLVGAFMIMGGVALGEVIIATIRRTRSTQTARTLLSMAGRVPFLTIPGALIALVFGTLLIPGHFSFSELWISLSYLAWIAAIGLSVGILMPWERRMHDLATREAAAGHEDSAELVTGLNNPRAAMTMHLLSLLLVVFLVLMVFKPGH